jgi:hypothetical protein
MSKSKAVVVTDDALGEQVFRERLAGAGVRQLAKKFGLTTQQVKAACVKLAPTIDVETRKAELALEIGRVDMLYGRFYAIAMEKGDDKAASICVRLSERRAALWGFDNAPLRTMDATIHVIQAAPRPNSTQRIQAALDALVAQRPARPLVEIEHEPVPDPGAQNGRPIT